MSTAFVTLKRLLTAIIITTNNETFINCNDDIMRNAAHGVKPLHDVRLTSCHEHNEHKIFHVK